MIEKKILCMEMESPCVKCGSKLCSICVSIKRYKSWPTREQAIKKMAKALEENLNGSSFNSLAEAALNSILEEAENDSKN